MPVSTCRLFSRRVKASSPPAEAPIPTIGNESRTGADSFPILASFVGPYGSVENTKAVFVLAPSNR